jgi:porin
MSPAILLAVLALGQGGDESGPPGKQVEAPSVWDREAFLGDLGSVRPGLEERGVTFTLAYTGELLANVHGGIDTGSEYEGLLDLVVDADLAKALGWNGGSMRLNPLWIEGQGLTRDYVGDLTRISNIDARDEVRLFEAWLQQALWEGAVSLRGGLLAADQEFAISAHSALFVNGTFGMPIVVSGNEPVPVYPLGALGLRLRAEPAAGFYLQGAVYEGHPGAEHQNETGMQLRLRDDEGTVTFVEAGWVREGPWAGSLKAGAVYHSADFVDHDSGEPERGHTAVYVVVEQALRPEGLAAFARVGGAPESKTVISFYVDAGLVYTGLLPGREEDVLGLAAVYAELSRDYADTQADPSAWDHEIVIEATYKVVISRWWSLQPDFQYVIHPGGSDETDDAFILGLRSDLLF